MPTPSSERAAKQDLSALAVIGPRVQEVVDLASGLGPTASLSALAQRVASKAGLPRSQVANALNGIWNVRTLQTNLQTDAAGVLRVLHEELDDEWLRNNEGVWNAAKESLCKILDSIDEDHPIFISRKAEQLAYSHERLLVRARLITDVRPVFDKSGEKIVESVITHTLAIQYTNELRRQSLISFVLDTDDIEQLSTACERAIQKGKVAAKQFSALKATVLPEPR